MKTSLLFSSVIFVVVFSVLQLGSAVAGGLCDKNSNIDQLEWKEIGEDLKSVEINEKSICYNFQADSPTEYNTKCTNGCNEWPDNRNEDNIKTNQEIGVPVIFEGSRYQSCKVTHYLIKSDPMSVRMICGDVEHGFDLFEAYWTELYSEKKYVSTLHK